MDEPADMNESIDLGMRHNTHRTLRAWEPGDGIACHYTRRASVNRPCGPPVAVRIHTSHPKSDQPHRHREVICAYHLTEEAQPGDLRAQAERQARELVLVQHWEEYQEAIEEYMRPLVKQTIGDLPKELKLLVLDALARYDRDRTGDDNGSDTE